MILNNFFKITLSLLIISELFIISAFAQTATQPRPPNFCSQINELSSTIGKSIADKESKYNESVATRESIIKNRRGDEDNNVARARYEAEKIRNELFAKIDARAKTETEKAAAAQFKTAVLAALSARRAMIDGAKNNYRAGLNQIITARKAAAEAVIAAFKKTESVAITKAKTDCANRVAESRIKSTLRATLKAGREKFINDINIIKKSDDAIKILIEARNQTIQKAQTDFSTAIENAKTALKTVFNEK